jgi:hypothetical protein
MPAVGCKPMDDGGKVNGLTIFNDFMIYSAQISDLQLIT